MSGIPFNLLDRAFREPEKFLGTVERNTEIKIVFFTLWELGWDPVQDIALCFQIPRNKMEPVSGAACAADFALRDDYGLCAVGEVKHWYASEKEWTEALTQIRRYQKALLVPRAFLSCGRRWIILNEQGISLHEATPKDARSLISELKPYLGKSSVKNSVRDSSLWEYGIKPSSIARL